MTSLLIPVAPLSKTKSRLRDCFSNEMLKDLTICLFKDLGVKLQKVQNIFNEILVYCYNSEILEIAEGYGLIGIKEELTTPQKSFNQVITDLNSIAVRKFNAQQTLISFLDLILIAPQNFFESEALLKKHPIVVCPAIHSAGISIFGRNPPEVISSFCFSDPNNTSLLSLYIEAKKLGIDIELYDSFRSGFDVDLKQDLVLAYKYLKLFNLKNTETYAFLKKNLKLTLQNNNSNNNRDFQIIKK